MGEMLAWSQSLEIIPDCSDLLNIIVKTGAMWEPNSFKILGDIESGPGAFEGFRSLKGTHLI